MERGSGPGGNWTVMASQTISERVSPRALPSSALINEEAGTISGAVLCGLESANRRRYPAAVHKRDHRKYEGVKVFFDHSAEDGRKFRDWVGVVRGPAIGEDSQPRGTLELFKSDPIVPKLLEAARKCPDKFGLSHVARCKTRREGGVDVIEEIEEVLSVDIVTDPATTKGLFENRGRAVGKTTIRTIFERNPERKALTEADMDAEVMDAEVVEPAADMPHEDALWAGFVDAMHTLFAGYKDGSMTAEEAGKEVSKYLKAHQKLTKPKDSDGDETPSESRTPDEDDAVIREAMAVCKKVGYRGFDETDLDIIARTPEADREAVAKRLMESRKTAENGEPARSAGRSSAAAPVEKKGGPVKESAPVTVPTVGSEFVKSIRK